jgi:Big-like domain-containing protein
VSPAFADRPRDFTFTDPFVQPLSGTPPYNTLFLNRCASGCIVSGPSTTDSRVDHSSIVSGSHTLTAFPYGDTVWQQVVACVKDTFAPFNVNVTDVDPGTANHFEIMIAGNPGDLGLPSTYGGVSPNGCGGAPGSYYIPNALVFDFAAVWQGDVEEICSTAAQEIAHSFALDHSYNAADPMTYFSFQGRRYFQDSADPCGSDCVSGQSPAGQTCSGPNNQQHACICTGSSTQNSYQSLRTLFGPGTIPPPMVAITNPKYGASVNPGFNVTATATGANNAAITKVELRVDNMLVMPVLTSFPYAFNAPSTLANGSHHVEVTAYDAHQTTGKAAIDVNIGPPCTKPSDCPNATDTCIGGRCVPGPGVQGGLGSPCTDGSMCAEGQCASDGTAMYCVSSCMPGQCPSGFGCLLTNPADPSTGVCWPGYDDGTGGCCSAARDGRGFIVLAFGVLLFAGRRRR